MNNCEIKNLNLLCHKRNSLNIIQKDESILEGQEKTKENNLKKKPEFFYISRVEKIRNNLKENNQSNLEEKNGIEINSINIENENKKNKKI